MQAPSRHRLGPPALLLFSLAGLAACAGDGDPKPTAVGGSEGSDGSDGDDGSTPGPDPYDVEVGPYTAEIRWTTHGIPHVQAADRGSVTFGLGYAFARDHFCTLMDQVVMVNSQRARYFGPGEDDLYVYQDAGWLGLGVKAQAEAGWFSLDPSLQAGLIGYAAGVNAWLDEVGVDGIPDPRCAGADFVRPIHHIDLLTYYLALGLEGSGKVFVDAVGSATPPTSARSAAPVPPPPVDRTLEFVREPLLGSNGWALGSERSESGGGMLLSNTHFPAVGNRKWHEFHLTIPGELNVYGAALMGIPLVNIGFNEQVAWTHTVSGAPRFIAVQLVLDPDDPTRYHDGDGWRDMVETVHSIEVLGDDGTVSTRSRSTWASSFGPVINAPVFGWSPVLAVAIQDANANNLEMLPTWDAMNSAGSLEEFQAAHRDHLGIPWVHTMAATADGRAWYIDSSAVPAWSDAAFAAWQSFASTDAISSVFAGYGVYSVPSDDPVFRWERRSGAREPGLVPYDEMPQLERSDFVYNANDNHWLTNPAAPLEGLSPLYGPERSPRSPRTRMNARYLADTSPAGPSGEDGRMSLAELEAAALSGRGILAEELLDDVLVRCEARREGGPWAVAWEDGTVEVDLGPGCDALAAWHGRVSTDAVGAVVWRELIGSGLFDSDDLNDAGLLWAEAFDPDDPVDTPRGLAASDAAALDEDPVLDALALALLRLEAAGLAPTTPLGEAQFLPRGPDESPVPFPGGQGFEGVIQIAAYSGGAEGVLLDVPRRSSVVNSTSDLTTEGYLVNYGNSWVMAVDYQDGAPVARAVMTYSQSEVRDSPHHADQTALYSDSVMRDIAFTEDQIAAATIESRTVSLD